MFMIAYVFFSVVPRESISHMFFRFASQRSPLYSHFSETLTGLSSIRAYGEQASFIAVNEQKLDNNNRAYYMQIQARVQMRQ